MDPIITLASTVQANKGVYAVLLGSGVSTSASILTGWGVVLDMIRRCAAADGVELANDEPTLVAWYRERFDREPTYSDLLERLAPTETERHARLRGYFERSVDEEDDAAKRPTDAHKAIAELVQRGYIRVVVTTNFDRLMEQALEQLGIVPTVLSTPEAIQGAVPLAHSNCVVVKVHGDYLDTTIRNTANELDAYDDRINRLLDQILDEYGLIVCGWSTESDTALRAAIERAPNRRYTTFWSYRSKLRDEAKVLIKRRRAVEIPGVTADQLFRQLAEGVRSLEELSATRPLTAQVAAQTVKRYLTNPADQIRLHDMVMQESGRIRRLIDTSESLAVNGPFSGELLDARLRLLEAESAVLMSMYAVAGYWCDSTQIDIWPKALLQLAEWPLDSGQSLIPYESIRRYPALLAFYAIGIAAVASGRDELLVPLISKFRARDAVQPKSLPLGISISVPKVLAHDYQQQLPGLESNPLPLHARLGQLRVLKDAVRIATFDEDQQRFDIAFDRFEYLFALLVEEESPYWRNLGLFAFRRWYEHQDGLPGKITAEIESMREDWPILRAGGFGGSLERALKAKESVDKSRPAYW